MFLILRPPGYSEAGLSWTPSDGPLVLGSSPGHVWFLGALEVSSGKMEKAESGELEVGNCRFWKENGCSMMV